jgi:hypothetical protein
MIQRIRDAWAVLTGKAQICFGDCIEDACDDWYDIECRGDHPTQNVCREKEQP